MRFRWRNAVIAAALYVFLGVALLDVSGVVLIVAIVYTLACIFGARAMILGAESRKSEANTVEFSRQHPATVLGRSSSSFLYVFDHAEPVVDHVLTGIATALSEKLGASELRSLTFRDIDRDLPKPEARAFGFSAAPATSRNTHLSVLLVSSTQGSVQGIRWWIFELGERDPNKVFWRYALAPISTPTTVVPYLRREFEPLHGLMSVDPGFFNSIDVGTRTREIERVSIDALVKALDGLGIDTSELKLQRANVLNINVGGGATATFGSLVQGAFNRVAGGGGHA